MKFACLTKRLVRDMQKSSLCVVSPKVYLTSKNWSISSEYYACLTLSSAWALVE
jgi:hypothetical protein